jgi:transposase
MRGGNKALKRIFYRSAFASPRGCAGSRAFYDRKRAEGKRRRRHTQAVVALARSRRVNVIWAMPRDGTEFEERIAAWHFHRDSSSRRFGE